MADEFKVIETQADFDARIKDRIARAEQKIKDQYTDYDTLKAQNSDYAKQIEQLQSEKAEIESERDKYSAQVNKYAKDALRTEVAREVGIPYGMADRITGDDKDAMIKDAEKIKKCFSVKPEAPFGGSGEPSGKKGDEVEDAWYEMSKSLEEN